MVWENYEGDGEDGKMSGFNAAALKMKRLDRILDSLNQINTNLFAWHEEVGTFNYEYKFRLCNQLYQEVESKLKKKEREEGENMRNAIEKFLEEHQVYKKLRGKKNQVLIEHTARIIRKWLDKFESLVRQYIDEHGMDTRYEDEDGL